jgi:hypothetical protein
MLEDLMHLTASLDPTPMRKLSACAKRGGRCHLSRPKGIGFRCIPQLVAPSRVGGGRPRDERSRRLDLSRPFLPEVRDLLKPTRDNKRGDTAYGSVYYFNPLKFTAYKAARNFSDSRWYDGLVFVISRYIGFGVLVLYDLLVFKYS